MPARLARCRPVVPCRRAALAALAFLSLGCTPSVRSPASQSVLAPFTPSETIRVGAWNIEWLGTPDSRSGPAKNQPQSPGALAEYIRASGVSVLGLEEIAQDDPAGQALSVPLTRALEIVSRETGSDWTHRLFPARTGRNQLTGVAWDRKRVSAVGEPVLVAAADSDSSQGKPLLGRPAFGMRFSAGSGKTDFVIVPLHLKSNYQGDFAVQRGEEAQLIRAGIARGVGDLDIILAGDFNCGVHTEPAIQTLREAGFVDLNAGDASTHTRYGALDRILVPADQPEFQQRQFAVFREAFLSSRRLSDEDFKIGWSDHFMVTTDVRVMPDDD